MDGGHYRPGGESARPAASSQPIPECYPPRFCLLAILAVSIVLWILIAALARWVFY